MADLNDRKIQALYRKALRGELPRTHKVFDRNGLYLRGGKFWKYAYRFHGTQKELSLGAYPVLDLDGAREGHQKARELLARGVDPCEAKRKAKRAAAREAREGKRTFAQVAREWWAMRLVNDSRHYRNVVWRRVEKHLLPRLGSMRMADVEFSDLRAALEHLHGKIDIGRRMAQVCMRICRHARIMGDIPYDISEDLMETLPDRPAVRHRAMLGTPDEVGVLLCLIDEYPGSTSVKFALRIMPHVFLRSKELRQARWGEIDLEKGLWTVPAERMKSRRRHVVPLSRQVRSLLAELRALTMPGPDGYVFPSTHSRTACITDVTLLNALRRMGYARDEMCVHGFRGIASTFLHEAGFNSEWIEAQLAHVDANATRAAYNAAEYMEHRAKMLQWWSDRLDALKAKAAGRSRT